MDIRTGTVLQAQRVKGTDKLLQLTVDVGTDVRTVVSGIAESFSPEEVMGKRVSVLINLVRRKIRGVKSDGMILMVKDGQGNLKICILR